MPDMEVKEEESPLCPELNKSKPALRCLRKQRQPLLDQHSSANLLGLALGMHRSYVRAAQSISSKPLNLHQASATIYPPLPYVCL